MMRGQLYSLLAILVTVVIHHGSVCAATRPGLTMRLSRPGINYAAQVAVNVLSKEVKGRAIPDQSGKKGKVSYDITGMSVTDFGGPSAVVTMQPGKGATLSLQGCRASVHGNWRYVLRVLIKVRDHGTFDISASGLGITVSVQIGMDKGRPTMKAYSCESRVGSLKLHIHGGASWLYNLFKGLLIKPIEKALKNAMCNAAMKAINESGAKQLKKLKLKVTLRKVAELDYSLIDKPLFATDYMESYHKGEVFYKGDYTEAPFQPGPMPTGKASGRMVDILASDYILNTMGLILQKHNLISYRLARNDTYLPPEYRFKLNTTCPKQLCMGSLLSQVAKKYPNSSFEIAMATTKPPVANFLTNIVSGSFVGDVIYYVRQPNGKVTHLCSTSVSCTVNVTGWVNGSKLMGKVSGFYPEVKESAPCSYGMTAQKMTGLFKMAGQMFIIPKLNELGKEGLEIPNMDNVKFTKPTLQIMKGYLRLATDLHYGDVIPYKTSDTLYYRSDYI